MTKPTYTPLRRVLPMPACKAHRVAAPAPRFAVLIAAGALLALASCATSTVETTPMPAARQPDSLEGATWRLVSAPDTAPGTTLSGAGGAELEFGGDRFAIRGPCNRHSGVFTRTGDQLRLGDEGGAVASTRMLCPPEIMQRESALLAAMAAPFSVEFEGPFLRLASADGAVWRFDSRAAVPAEGRVRILQVAGQRVPCTGVAPMLCLQVRGTPGAAWELHYGEIEGFDWQVGVEYVIRVRELPVANPPADGSALRWVLEEVLERSPPG